METLSEHEKWMQLAHCRAQVSDHLISIRLMKSFLARFVFTQWNSHITPPPACPFMPQCLGSRWPTPVWTLWFTLCSTPGLGKLWISYSLSEYCSLTPKRTRFYRQSWNCVWLLNSLKGTNCFFSPTCVLFSHTYCVLIRSPSQRMTIWKNLYSKISKYCLFLKTHFYSDKDLITHFFKLLKHYCTILILPSFFFSCSFKDEPWTE